MATKSKKTAAKRITAAKAKAIKGAKGRATKAAKAKAAKPAKSKPAAKGKPAAGAPKAGTKIAQLTEMLSRKDGASNAELCKALGWQPHTLRAAISRLPVKPERSRVDGVTSYRIGA